jgi:hypothetical protein
VNSAAIFKNRISAILHEGFREVLDRPLRAIGKPALRRLKSLHSGHREPVKGFDLPGSTFEFVLRVPEKPTLTDADFDKTGAQKFE